jgi:hypothetical protein
MLTVKLNATKNYGNLTFYPANDAARAIAAIAGTKTLTKDAIAQCLVLGARIECVGDVTGVSDVQDIVDRMMAHGSNYDVGGK